MEPTRVRRQAALPSDVSDMGIISSGEMNARRRFRIQLTSSTEEAAEGVPEDAEDEEVMIDLEVAALQVLWTGEDRPGLGVFGNDLQLLFPHQSHHHGDLSLHGIGTMNFARQHS